MITTSYSSRSTVAGAIAGKWNDWNGQRTPALSLWAEIDAYIHATDTSQIEGGNNFDHKTFIPMVSELHSDLVAIIYSTMFPNDDWLGWRGYSPNAITVAIREKMLSYIKEIHSLNGFSETARKYIDDLVRYGNCFARTDYVNEGSVEDNEYNIGYLGPKPCRISPYDIVFDPTCSSFKKAPKVIRSLVSLGDFLDFAKAKEGQLEISEEEVQEIVKRRTHGRNYENEQFKDQQYVPSGFSSMSQYYSSGYIEMLSYYGDIHDTETGEVVRNRCITCVDRDTIVLNKPEKNQRIFKGGWKHRPDNLWSQGPLDNIVGMNYMINHRENGKNDAIDKFIYPDRAYVGDVEEIYDEDTGHTKYLMPDGGSVTDITPDTTVLTYDSQILMHRDLARAAARLPQQLTGFRTAGEKTAFEVQNLNDGAFRGFINIVSQVEEEFLEPLIASEIQLAKDNFTSVIQVMEEDEVGVQTVREITEEDLKANGKLVPYGSRRFAKELQQASSLNNLANSNLFQVMLPHIDSYRISRVAESLFGFDKYAFVKKFASIDEGVEAQERQMLAEQEVANTAMTPTPLEMELQSDEF